MKKRTLISIALVIIVNGCKEKDTPDADVVDKPYENIKTISDCGDKFETPDEEAVSRMCSIIADEFHLNYDKYSEYGPVAFDIDGDGTKEILVYATSAFKGGGAWWLRYYFNDGAWHQVSSAPFMRAYHWEVYRREDDVKTQPRMFYKQTRTQSASAIIFDREKGTVTLEPFDFEEFEELRKNGDIKPYEDVGQDDPRPESELSGRERYGRHEGDNRQPRLFYLNPEDKSVKAVFIDNIGARIESFDFEEFKELLEQGVIKLRD
jgi:hypothetical protein